MVLHYVDRQIVSILKPTLKQARAIDDRGYALLVNVFTLCDGTTYAGAGWLVDRFGAGRMMLLGIVGWSCACLGAGLTRTFNQLAVLRGRLGIAEPLAFPAQLRTVTIWFSPRRRATANSICAAGSTIGALMAALLVAWLARRFGWQVAFMVPGILGLLVGISWWQYHRDPPADFAAAETGARAAPAFTWPGLWLMYASIHCQFIEESQPR